MVDPITAVVAVALITLLRDGNKKQREHDPPLPATGVSQVAPETHLPWLAQPAARRGATA